jgi:hypothetical protein
LATVVPTPKQRSLLDSKIAKAKGEKGGSQTKKNKALIKAIRQIVINMADGSKKPSFSEVWAFLESYNSHSPYNTEIEGCEDLFVDGDTLFWTDFTQNGITKSLAKRSLERYVREAKQKSFKARN